MIRRYPSLFLLGAVIAGIVISDQTPAPAWVYWAASLISFVIGVFLANHRPTAAAVCLGLTFLTFAAFHFGINYSDTGPNHISRHINTDRPVRIYGQVSDWPRMKGDRTELSITLDSVISDRSRSVNGTILLKITDTTTSLQRGDRLEFFARIYPVQQRQSSGQFDYGRYLNLHGIFGVVYLPTTLGIRVDKVDRFGLVNVVDRLRKYIIDAFQTSLSPTASALASGFLIGETRNIPRDVYQRFRDTGTLHLLAVSGSNVAIVILFFVYVLKPFRMSRPTRSLVLMGIVFLFWLLAYQDPSVTRASIMAALVIGAGIVQRRYDLNNIIAATALIILLVEPAQFFDIGFQLSFVTAWGLIFVTGRLNALVPRRWGRWGRVIIFFFIVSLVAQAYSTPLIAYHFQRVPLISVLANLVIVPLVSIAVVGILTLLVATLILPILGLWVGSLLDQLLNFILSLLDYFGADGIAIVQLPNLPVAIIVMSYAVMTLGVVAISSTKTRRWLAISILVISNLILAMQVVSSLRPADDYRLTAFAVPGGIAVAVEPVGSEKFDLILTGLSRKEYRIDELVIGPALERKGLDRIDRIVVLSADYGAIDNILRLAGEWRPSKILIPGKLYNSFLDAYGMNTPSNDSLRIAILGNHVGDIARPGFYPRQDGLILKVGQTSALIIASALSPDQLTSISNSTAILFDGSSGKVASSNIRAASTAGVNLIVAKQITSSGPGAADRTENIPELIDLYRRDYLVVGIRDNRTEIYED